MFILYNTYKKFLKGIQMIVEIINELNSSTSSIFKLNVLKKYSDNQLLKDVLRLAYDKVNFNFYVSKSAILNSSHGTSSISPSELITFDEAIKTLFAYCQRIKDRDLKQGGSDCIKILHEIYNSLPEFENEIFLNIIGRDLKCNISTKQINKIFKNIIPKPNYMRCDVYSQKTLRHITFPAYIQLKMDGTYREFRVDDGVVTSKTRSGEIYKNPVLFEQLKDLPNGYYIGELTIEGDNRFKGNGLINSDNPPYDDIVFTMWDFLTFEDYNLTTATQYGDRFSTLTQLIHDFKNLRVVETHKVNNIQEALQYVNSWMSNGLEGGVLKDLKNTFKNGTSKTQLKIKLCIDADVRITGFTDGTIGTKREGKIGAIKYESDDGLIKGQCSGFSDEQLELFTKTKDELIGKIMAVQFNDLVKGRDKNYYALSHPRFIEIRTDKTETDTLERVMQLREMAMEIK